MGKFQIQAYLLIIFQAHGEQPVVPAPPSLLPWRSRRNPVEGPAVGMRECLELCGDSICTQLCKAKPSHKEGLNSWMSLDAPTLHTVGCSWDVPMGCPGLQSQNSSSEGQTLVEMSPCQRVPGLSWLCKPSQDQSMQVIPPQGQLQWGFRQERVSSTNPRYKC